MKSSTLMAIILVVQAVLIMGVFAAVSLENSVAPAVGEKEDTEGCIAGELKCCNKCIPSGNSECGNTCDDMFPSAPDCVKTINCTICSGPFGDSYKCLDAFKGACPKKCEN